MTIVADDEEVKDTTDAKIEEETEKAEIKVELSETEKTIRNIIADVVNFLSSVDSEELINININQIINDIIVNKYMSFMIILSKLDDIINLLNKKFYKLLQKELETKHNFSEEECDLTIRIFKKLGKLASLGLKKFVFKKDISKEVGDFKQWTTVLITDIGTLIMFRKSSKKQ